MKYYSLSFGTGDPRTFTGLAPTMLVFVRLTDGQTLTPPAVTESLTGTGFYQFQYGTTQPIAFLCDGATNNLGGGRYVRGGIDPNDRSDEYGNTLVALGTSIYAQGTSFAISIGTTGSTFGGSGTDPVDLFGYNKRLLELLEGNASFNKSTGAWSLYSRGSSTLLRSKTLSNATTGVTKL